MSLTGHAPVRNSRQTYQCERSLKVLAWNLCVLIDQCLTHPLQLFKFLTLAASKLGWQKRWYCTMPPGTDTMPACSSTRSRKTFGKLNIHTSISTTIVDTLYQHLSPIPPSTFQNTPQ